MQTKFKAISHRRFKGGLEAPPVNVEVFIGIAKSHSKHATFRHINFKAQKHKKCNIILSLESS